MEQLEGTRKHWLMKAEPDSRVVKGKDVKARPIHRYASSLIINSLVLTTLSHWDSPHGKAFATMKRETS